MITEKLALVKLILEEHEAARGDGYGYFLNVVHAKIYGLLPVDFRVFNTESFTRARRKVMEQHPELDNRTKKTDQAEATVRKEMLSE